MPDEQRLLQKLQSFLISWFQLLWRFYKVHVCEILVTSQDWEINMQFFLHFKTCWKVLLLSSFLFFMGKLTLTSHPQSEFHPECREPQSACTLKIPAMCLDMEKLLWPLFCNTLDSTVTVCAVSEMLWIRFFPSLYWTGNWNYYWFV